MLFENLRDKINDSSVMIDLDNDSIKRIIYQTNHPYKSGDLSKSNWLRSSRIMRKNYLNNFLDYIEENLKNGKEYIFSYSSSLSTITLSSTDEIKKMQKEFEWKKNIVSMNNIEEAEKNIESLIKYNWLYFPLKSGLIIDGKEQNLKFISEDIDKFLLLENKEKFLNLHLLDDLSQVEHSGSNELMKQVMKILFKDYLNQSDDLILQDFLSVDLDSVELQQNNNQQIQKDLARVFNKLESSKTKSMINKYLMKISSSVDYKDIEKTFKLAKIIGYMPFDKDVDNNYLMRIKKLLSELSIEEIKNIKRKYEINLHSMNDTSYFSGVNLSKFLEILILKREIQEKNIKEEDLFKEENTVIYEKILTVSLDKYKVIIGFYENLEGDRFSIKGKDNDVILTLRSEFEINLPKKELIDLLKVFYKNLRGVRKDINYLINSKDLFDKVYEDFLMEIKNLQREYQLQKVLTESNVVVSQEKRKKI